MPVQAFITRDPQGNPWPPVHEHEATAAIGLLQRLHEALHHEPQTYAVFANLHTPSADIVVVTEMGIGVAELKHVSGALNVVAGDWYGDRQLIKAGAQANTPREQAQNYAARMRRELVGAIADFWQLNPADLTNKLKLQSAVIFTNPLLMIDPAVKRSIETDAAREGLRWSAFQLLTPAEFPAWVGGLRFGMERDRSAQFAPYRLTARQIAALAQAYFKANAWTEVASLMPNSQPHSYLALHQPGQEPILFPLRANDVVIGRDGAQVQLPVPDACRRTSRVHARFFREAQYLWVEDCGSRHGTFVAGKRISNATRLRVGQSITLGGPAIDEDVCELRYTQAVPADLRAGATARDDTGDAA